MSFLHPSQFLAAFDHPVYSQLLSRPLINNAKKLQPYCAIAVIGNHHFHAQNARPQLGSQLGALHIRATKTELPQFST